MMQMAIETYCAEIEGLKQKLEERDRKIAKLEYANEKLHTLTDLQEANVNIMHENTMKLRKEIERLKEERKTANMHDLMYWFNAYNECVADCEKYVIEASDNKAECMRLQKQVDELKERAKIDLENEKNWGKIQTKQAVKDTAKEIFTAIVEEFVFSFKTKNEDYQNGYDQALTDYNNNLKNFFKERYGVEVE